MYSYNNIPYGVNTYPNVKKSNIKYQCAPNANDDRFIGPFLGPLLLGGIAGYALRPPYPAPYPVPIYPSSPVYVPYNNPNMTYTTNSYYY